ncbi:hypothetical protein FBU59_006671 [Linderina macrospora]|uniref:Uncharacterized protein n=1 Tax=Linderina macrospora TaxID=4868 RepID=A0ACC1IZG3_9FUNG|nr:hypothetical protein FBU59_006671 [Linderina macrospora]
MTYLVRVYVRQLRDFYLSDTEDARHSAKQLMEGYRCAQADNLALTFRAYLESVCNQDSGTSLRFQLLAILCARPLSYDPGEVLGCIEAEAKPLLLTEQAVLLVILDRTNESVDILVNELQDYAEAELLLLRPGLPESLAQMNQAHRDLSEESDDDQSGYWLLHQQTATSIANELRSLALGINVGPESVRKLLDMYIALGETDDEMAARLVSGLLAKYGQFAEMDVLDTVPDHWQFSVVEKFVVSKFQKLTHSAQTSNIERSVHQSLSFQSELGDMESKKRRGPLVLDYTQKCAKCGKLLGSSAFALVPESNDILHLTCLG